MFKNLQRQDEYGEEWRGPMIAPDNGNQPKFEMRPVPDAEPSYMPSRSVRDGISDANDREDRGERIDPERWAQQTADWKLSRARVGIIDIYSTLRLMDTKPRGDEAYERRVLSALHLMAGQIIQLIERKAGRDWSAPLVSHNEYGVLVARGGYRVDPFEIPSQTSLG